MIERKSHISDTSTEFLLEEVESSLCRRFERVVQSCPQAIAVKDKHVRWTYEELNRSANKIAHAILASQAMVLSDSRQEPIAILFGQTVGDIAALLGILKSGRFYVPLDPSYPIVRCTRILEDAGSKLLLTDSTHFKAAQKMVGGGCEVLNLDTLPADLSSSNPRLGISPDALAYMIYTSGSSGEPKGVLQNHRNVLFDIWRQGRDLKTSERDHYGLLFSSSSSASICHIFGALLNGATVCRFDFREEGFSQLANWLVTEKISILDINVATFRHFCSYLSGSEKFPDLRLLAPGSEPVYARDVELYKKHFASSCTMQNALGTTETRTVTQYFIHHDTDINHSLVPVGVAVDGKEVLLLNDEGKEVADGEIGEIAVRSRYLSPGYWNRPQQTQAVFREDPQGGDQRMYLTGDLGQRNDAGLLVHLGRKDFQVKVRGYRIEIAEVEMALTQMEGISDAAVATFEDHTGNLQLIAYIVLKDDFAPSISELRSSLKETLPDYAVPVRFEFLETLPLTLNGKLDRRALKPSCVAVPLNVREYVAPVGVYEVTLAQEFAEILGVEQVGATDDFFLLGGHSLLAARLAMSVEKRWQIALPLSIFLSAPTVRQLGNLLSQAQGRPVRRSPTLISAGDRSNSPLFCVHGSAGSSMEFQHLGRCLGDSRAVYGFDPVGIDGLETPQTQIPQMARLYIEEMQTVQSSGPYCICGFSMGGLIALEMGAQLRAAGKEVALVALFDTYFPNENLNPETKKHFKFRHLENKARQMLGFKWWNFHFRLCLFRGKAVPRQIRRAHMERAHLRAVYAYTPPRFLGRLAYFRAIDPKQSNPPEPLDRGWQHATGANVEIYLVPGEHSLLKEPFVQELARQLKGCLEKSAAI